MLYKRLKGQWICVVFVLLFENFQAEDQGSSVIRRFFFSFFVVFIILFQPVYAEQTGIVQTNEVIVLFEEPLRLAGKEVADIYPGLKRELEKTLGLRLDFKPKVLLINERKTFERMAGSNLIVAFAVPQKRLVVIDYSKMHTHPFTLRTTLKHELCHLLLGHHIRRAHLPKWLDEGVAQWVSDGIAEIIMDQKRSVLKEATLSGDYIGMDHLTESFPDDRESLLLAYEESKSLVEYVNSKFGKDGIRTILNHLKDGDEVDVAIQKGLSIPLDELERRWHHHLRKSTTWFTYLARNLYGILFFLAAVITIYGFIRLLIKKRRYEDLDEDDSSPL